MTREEAILVRDVEEFNVSENTDSFMAAVCLHYVLLRGR